MRRFLVLLVLLLAACDGGRPAAPGSLRLGYDGRGLLNLPLAGDTIWALDPGPLELSPAQGVGPATIEVRASGPDLPDQPLVSYELAWSGDLSGVLRVDWPLVRVSGQVFEDAGVNAALPAAALPEAAGGEEAGRVVVRYRSAAAAQGLEAGDATLRILESSDPEALLAGLQEDPNVVWAELDGQVHALGEPADEYYPLEWHLRKTGARWAYLASLPDPVTVAVIDTGVRYDHPDLAGRLWTGADGAYDFVNDDDDPTDEGDNHNPTMGSHGTHVTGIIAARSGVNVLPPVCYDDEGNPICSQTGLVGLTWPAAVTVLPLRVLDENGNGSYSAVAAAIRYAAGLSVEWLGKTLVNPHPAAIINLSLGAAGYSETMCEAVADAVAAGALVVAAAGNNGASTYYYPASCPGAISVAATDNTVGDPQPTWYSEHNDLVDISAPGGDTRQDADEDGYPDGVLSTTWNFQTNTPNYAFYMGTSQASPQIAAALALLMASGQSAEQAWETLKNTATDLGEPGYDPYYGHGFPNVPAALGLTLPPGPYLVHFEGPARRWVRTDADGRFSTYLPSGDYRLEACRDDTENGFCDGNESRAGARGEILPQPAQTVAPLRLNSP